MMQIYKWCPNCDESEVLSVKKEPKVDFIGTDGYGQPVRFSKCKCGDCYGWLRLDFYSKDKLEESFLSYLKHRIKFYAITSKGE